MDDSPLTHHAGSESDMKTAQRRVSDGWKTLIAPTDEASTVHLVALGAVSAALFSATFVLNYAMRLDGGHWVWSASLRFLYMIAMLSAWVALRHGPATLIDVFRLFARHAGFLTIAGMIGFGLFYGGICFAADHARGWVVAATWQLFVVASPIILYTLGFRFPVRGAVFSVMVLIGVTVINLDGLGGGDIAVNDLLLGVLPVLLAAFAYPLGNQMLNAAKNGGLSWVPRIESDLLAKPSIAVLLMSLGSVPLWLALIGIEQPPAPSTDQWIGTFLVALLSGVMATSIFYLARNATADPYRIAAVDAAQSLEVPIALGGEMLILAAAAPSLGDLAGLALLTAGLAGYCLRVRRG